MDDGSVVARVVDSLHISCQPARKMAQVAERTLLYDGPPVVSNLPLRTKCAFLLSLFPRFVCCRIDRSESDSTIASWLVVASTVICRSAYRHLFS